jgi:hypothetical protein
MQSTNKTRSLAQSGALPIAQEVAQLIVASPRPSEALRNFDRLVWQEVLTLEHLARVYMNCAKAGNPI